MVEYYGVQRSKDYLAHYGVQGMKWGVKKSLETLSSNPKSKAYSNVEKKLKHKIRNKRGLTSKQALLEKEWSKASKAYDEALASRNKGLNILRPKKQRELEAARTASQEAAGRFFDSMSEKELKRYHDKYLY